MKFHHVAIMGAALVACSPPAANAPGGSEAASAVAKALTETAPTSGEERFYGKQSFTIVAKHTGAESGERIEYVRDWGRTRAEIKKTAMSFSGISQKTNTRTVFEKAKMTTVNLDTGAVTTTTNPLYDDVAARVRAGGSAVEFGKQIMLAMGGEPTGEKGAFAGIDCDYWKIPRLGARSCVTPWGATLHQTTSLGGISMEFTATAVRLNDGGPDAVFAYDAAKAVAQPNLQDIMKQARAKAGQ